MATIAQVSKNKNKSITVTISTGTTYTLDYTGERPTYKNETTKRTLKRCPLCAETVATSYDHATDSELRAALRILHAIIQYAPDFDRWAPGFSFLDLLNSDGYIGFYTDQLSTLQLPKGFIPWCRKNGRTVCGESLEDFETHKMRERHPRIPEGVMKVFRGRFCHIPEECWDAMAPCVAIDHKNWVNVFDYQYSDYIREMCAAGFQPDPNRGIEYNYDRFCDVRDELLSERIRERQARFAAIADLHTDSLTVKLPLTLGDLQNEGRQQNNCVGHYYNDEILAGKQVIYFIRRTDAPEVSYHTCRYSVNHGHTVEDRVKNNRTESNAEVKALRDAVDAIISEVLRG